MTAGKQSLKNLVLRGSAWTLVGVGAGQAIRLGKSLILSRLLFPEAYGVMAIVWAVLYALDMLSDVGISPAVIRSQRGDEPNFLNTAWTAKAIRGAVLCAVAVAMAYPISVFYKQPDLSLFVAIAGLTTLLDGFCSTNVYSCQRNMDYSKVTLLELSHEIVGLLVTLTWAYLYPSAWALLGGAVVSRIYLVAASHILLPGIKNQFHWDPKAFHELLHFGKWIFFSSVVYLIYAQGDRMLLGKYLDATTLGVYSIAIMLSESVANVVNKLNTSVLYPALSRVANSELHRLQAVFYRTRLGTDALMVIPIGILIVIGENLVHILYDSRYSEAGWMFQILCVRLMMTTVLVGGSSCLLVLGHSKYLVIQNIFRAIWILLGIPIVWPIYGLEGVVWVVGLTEVPVFFVVWFGMAKNRILSVKHEMRALLFITSGFLIGLALLQLPISRA